MVKLVYVSFQRPAKGKNKSGYVAAGLKVAAKRRKAKTKVAKSAKSDALSFFSVKPTSTVDADSKTFGRDLESAFIKNVRRARRENSRLLGAADGATRKS